MFPNYYLQIEFLEKFLSPQIFIVTLAFGYLIFYLYFHETSTRGIWSSLSGGERLFFGFLIGYFVLILAYNGVCNIYNFIKTRVLLYSPPSPNECYKIWYILALFIMASLAYMRVKYKTKLRSGEISAKVGENLKKGHLPYFGAPIFLFLFLSTIVISSSKIYQAGIVSAVTNYWLSLLVNITSGIFLVTLSILILALMTFEMSHLHELYIATKRFVWRTISKEKYYIIGIILLSILSGSTVTSLDKNFSIFTPTILSIQDFTDQHPEIDVIGRIDAYDAVIYMYRRFYFNEPMIINLPYVNSIIKTNITVQNPSNYAFIYEEKSEGRKFGTFTFETSSGIAAIPIVEQNNEVHYINLIFLPSDYHYITFSYYQKLEKPNLEFLILETYKTRSQNNMVKKGYNMTFYNDEDVDVIFRSFGIIRVPYQNVTAKAFLGNNQIDAHIDSYRWLIIDWLFVRAHEKETIRLEVTYFE